MGQENSFVRRLGKGGCRMRYETWSYDIRLEDLCRKAEARRKWYWRIDWWSVLGGLICMASAAVVVTGFTYAYIYAAHWVR